MVSDTPSLLTKFLGHVSFFPLLYSWDSLPASVAFGISSVNNLLTTGCIIAIDASDAIDASGASSVSGASGISFELFVKVTSFRY